MINELNKYFKDVLGIEFDIKAIPRDRLKKLPVYLKNEYNLYQVSFYGRNLIFVKVKGDFTTESLRKHLNIIKNKFNQNTVAIIKQLEAYKRLRLIEKKIPFVVPDKQMFMPDLLIDLKEFSTAPQELPKAMTPATQLLLLYHLQVESLEGINLKNIADKLYYDSATITRSVKYLNAMNLCSIQGTKDKLLRFDMDKKELWKKTETLMSNPIQKSMYYAGWTIDKSLLKSNNNALAHYSNLNDDIVEYYAVRTGYQKNMEGANFVRTARFEGNVCIEEWKYNPNLLSKNEFVDPLSLYLCFRDNQDERVEMALEQIINNIKW